MSADFGLGNPLYEPEKGKAQVDIVFVHGLGGNRIKTWTANDIDCPTFWPKELLPESCPTARIFSFGYNADFAHFYPSEQANIAPELTIDNYSTSLIESLAGERGRTGSDRPIIFIAHSLGGLVVANALSRPHGTDGVAQGIANSTIGVIFMGTPFKGSEQAAYGKFALRIIQYLGVPNQPKSIEALQARSDKLKSIGENFAKYIKTRDRRLGSVEHYLEIACFVETLPTRKGCVNIGLIVTQDSSTLWGFNPISIHKTHQGMCTFQSPDESGYRQIVSLLKDWVAFFYKPPEEKNNGQGQINVKMIDIRSNGGVVTGVISGSGTVIGSKNTHYHGSSNGNPTMVD